LGYGWYGGFYHVQGAPLTTDDTLIIKNDSVILGIHNNMQTNGVIFFTRFNQSTNSVVIEVHSISELNNGLLIINDITGRELMHKDNLTGTDFIINKANLSKGVYIISLINNQKIIAHGKVIVE
jgi:hypothetical protein